MRRNARKHADGTFAPARQFELRFLADALVRIREQAREFGGGPVLKAIAHELLRFIDEWRLRTRGIEHAIDATLASLVPAVHPIADVKRAVVAEVAIGSEKLPDELRAIDQLETRAFRLARERVDAAPGAAAEIAQKEMFVIGARKTDTGIIRQS